MLCLAAVAVLACQTPASSGQPAASGVPGEPGQSAETAGGPGATRAAAPTDCRRRIEAARLDSHESLDAVEACRFTEDGTMAAMEVLQAGGENDVIWAAIWVYAPFAADPAPLRPYVDRKDVSIRVLAAAGLVALGDAGGFGALAAAATDTTTLSGSHPPIKVRELVIGTFRRYVTAAGAPTTWTTVEEYLGTGQRWAEWISANSAELAFDDESGTWVLP